MKNLRIIFMGTSEFAVATLGSMLMNGLNVVAVVTAPDKPAGRGRKISESPVKIFALESELPVLQPVRLKDPDFISLLKQYKADLFVVVAFRMLPREVWEIPPMKTINLHASLLPHYRGAAPINHVIMNGEKTTGVSTFLIDNEIDAGKILMRRQVRIYPFENAGDLHDRLMKIGALLVIRTIEGLIQNSLKPRSQSEFLKPGEKPKEAPKIFPENCLINWDHDPVTIHNFIRGLAPSPCARTYFSYKDEKHLVKVLESQPEMAENVCKPGQIVSDGKKFLKIACHRGFINVTGIQIEGKRRMTTEELLRGMDISAYSVSVI